jgi:hypothetical protein
MLNIKKVILFAILFLLVIVLATNIHGLSNILSSTYSLRWQGEQIASLDFEEGSPYTGWTGTSVKQSDDTNMCGGQIVCGLIVNNASLAHTGDYAGFIGGAVDRYETLTSSVIALDTSADKTTIDYYYRISTAETSGEDTFRVAVYDETDGHTKEILVKNDYTSDDLSENAWLSDSFDLTGLMESKGVNAIKLEIFGWNGEDLYPTSFYIDDISVLGTWGDTEASISNSISINSGASATNNSSVTLTLSSSDTFSGVEFMKFSNDGTNWSGWYDYSTTATWSLASSTQGMKTVSVQFRDRAGNTSSSTADSITYDSKAPTGSIKINAGAYSTTSKTVTLKLSSSDVNSGKQMRFSNNRVLWSAWESYNSTKSWKMTSGTYGGNTSKGKKYVYVQYKDIAGNASTKYSDYIYYR